MSLDQRLRHWYRTRNLDDLKAVVVFMRFRMFWNYDQSFRRAKAAIPDLTLDEWDRCLREIDDVE